MISNHKKSTTQFIFPQRRDNHNVFHLRKLKQWMQ